MGEASLVRTARFTAEHRYWRDEWSEEENRRVFGAASRAHGHVWTVEVTVRGPIHRATGFVIDLGALDELLDELVEGLDGGDVNRIVPEAREGRMVPTTENMARWFWDRLASRIPGAARLVRVRVAESDTLAAEYEG
ncbi:MAG TPA: 6-carboxytetrahydropterin synthase [Longimicrobiales bacterium]|nr:6-carboxytetrahydropterin synthase [Longimicrobiales bacterium]